jgi:hypothetical protein
LAGKTSKRIFKKRYSLTETNNLVALGAEGDEVLFGVVAEGAPRVDVVDVEVSTTAAVLAAPIVSL